MARGPGGNQWQKPVIRWLRGGLITLAEAARIAGVSRQRVKQWCDAEGIDAVALRELRLAMLYAGEFKKMAKREYSRLRHGGKATEDRRELPPFMAPLVKRRSRPPGPSKSELREQDLVQKFIAAGGNIVRLPSGIARGIKQPKKPAK